MTVLQQPGHMLSFSNLEQMALTSGVAARLLIAALFGGLIGLDRARLKKMLRECECMNEVLSFHSSEDD